MRRAGLAFALALVACSAPVSSALGFGQVPGSPFGTQPNSPSIAFSPNGGLIAVANHTNGSTTTTGSTGSVSVFSVNEMTGSLSGVPGSPFANPAGAVSVAFSPAGTQLAVANLSDSVSVFSVNQRTGALRAVSGSPFIIRSPGTAWVAFSPRGGLLAVANGTELGSTVAVFSTAVGPPSVSIRSPASGARYAQRQVIAAKYGCAESAGGTGIMSCTGPVASGGRVDTTRRGRYAFTVTSVSKDGKRNSRTVIYTVGPPSNQFIISRVNTNRGGTTTLSVNVPGPGSIDVLETAWNDNLARIATLLQAAPRRFVFARQHRTVRGAVTIRVTVRPNAQGVLLLQHPTYPVALRLWVTFTPTAGRSRSRGFYGLRIPSRR